MRCPGSGQVQVLDWPPTDTYQGAVVCMECTLGVLVRKGSVVEVTVKGQVMYTGIVKVHQKPDELAPKSGRRTRGKK